MGQMVETYLGEIRMFGGNYVPEGWALCDGSHLAISGNEALYTLIGTRYGGNGVTDFALPDMRGRVPIGQGQGVGLTNRVMGELLGAETVALTTANMPSHNHQMQATTKIADTKSPENAMFAKADVTVYTNTDNPAKIVTQSEYGIQEVGSNIGHNNVQPFLAITFMIALLGTFPVRN